MFLPPLTTFVTRLIATTWSFRLNWPASIFFLLIAIVFLLELESSFTRCICQRLDTAVIQIAAAVKNHFLYALFMRALGDRLAHILRRCDVATGPLAIALLGKGRCRSQRYAGVVVDQLRVDVVQRAVDVQPRPLGRAAHLLANARVHALANYVA